MCIYIYTYTTIINCTYTSTCHIHACFWYTAIPCVTKLSNTLVCPTCIFPLKTWDFCAGIHHGAMDLSFSPTPQTESDLTTNNPWESHRLALFAPPRMWKIMKHLQKIFEVTATLHVDSIFRVLQNKLFELFTLFWAPVQQMVQTYSWWLQCLDFWPNFEWELQCETPMLGENITTRMPEGKKSS